MGCRKRVYFNGFHLLILTFFFIICQSNYNVEWLSIILALQRRNETYKYIKYPYIRVQVKMSDHNNLFCRNLFLSFFILVVATWTSFIVILGGDVEINPGPGSVEGDSDSSNDNSFEILANHLSILHLNVQSLLPILDLIAAKSETYDVLVFSESWLKPDIKNDSISLNNFHPPFRTGRPDRSGGGVVIYVRDSIYCKHRNDIEVQGLEKAWVEIRVKFKTFLVGGVYRPQNSNAAYFELISESIDRAYNTYIIDIFLRRF